MTTAPRSFARRERIFTAMRYGSNALVILGYFVLMNVDLTTGIIIRLLSACLVLPWMIQNKIWDGATVISLMTSIDLHKLVTLLLS